MNIKLPTLIIYLLFGSSVYGQTLSLYTETKDLSIQNYDSKKDEFVNSHEYKTLESFGFTQHIGALFIKKQITYFGEITLAGHKRYSFSESLFSQDKKEDKTPMLLNYSGKVGLGKSFRINKNIEYHLLGFIGYGYRRRRNLNTKSWGFEEVEYLEYLSKSIYPSYHDIKTGIKIMIDYRILKAWSLGLSLENTLEFTYSNSEYYRKYNQFNNIGDVTYETENLNRVKTTAFNSSFFNLGIHVRYIFNK